MPVPLLVSTEWLADHFNDPRVRIVDVRWYLLATDGIGRQEYLKGHIPGAVFMDIETDLASPRGQGPGRHPLPRPEALAQAASRAGIGPDTYVIAYDDKGGSIAARLWWLLKYLGHDQVSLLDGGIAAWIAEGRPLEKAVPVVKPATFVPHPQPDMVVDADTVNVFREDPHVLLLDVRASERYEGKTEPIDPRAGHVPGARSAPYSGNVQPDQRFKNPSELRERFQDLGADKAERIVCYCGSGVNACQTIFALELAGFARPILYEGSWSDWSSQSDRPMVTGPDPK